MSEFGLDWPWVVDGATPGAELLRVVAEARTAGEREAGLRALSQAAAGADPAAVERYAIGLAIAGQYTESLRFWRILLSHLPGEARLRLNTATCLLKAGRGEECAHELAECDRRCRPADPLRPLVQQRVAELARARAAVDREWQLLDLRAEAHRERVAQGRAGVGDLKDLCRVLGALTKRPSGGDDPAEMLAVARRIRAEAPHDTEGRELLVWSLLLADRKDELAQALRELEQVAPDSPVLAGFRSQVTDPQFRSESDELKQRWDDLADRAARGEPGAEEELRRELAAHPKSEQLRVALLFAVYGRAAAGRGDYAEARQLALDLADDPGAGHHTHFHVAQFLWGLGEQARARQEFALALATSTDEESRENVRLAMRTVGADTAEPRG